MKRIFISIVNVASLIPILVLLITGPIAFIMSFDAPGSESDPWMWFMRITIFGVVPLAIIVFICLSQIFRSIILALIAAIPVLYFTYDIFLKPDYSLRELNASSRDFLCEDDAHISMGEIGIGAPLQEMQWISYHQKRSINSARNTVVGALYKNHFVPKSSLGYIKGINFLEGETKTLLCKNKEGKQFQELYPLASDELIKEINQRIDARKG